ncbi:MAG: hypothetical protein MUF10_19080 [Thermoanaerobaculaceae bacterium]|nr:hypothetical protein [Thermoanaerobaculaceae bacterium]
MEKLELLPHPSAISSWLQPSTSCNQSTQRAVSESCPSAASRSTRAMATSWGSDPAAGRRLASSSSSSVSAGPLRCLRSFCRALEAATLRTHPAKEPSPRKRGNERKTSRNVSWSTSSASCEVRQSRRARV